MLDKNSKPRKLDCFDFLSKQKIIVLCLRHNPRKKTENKKYPVQGIVFQVKISGMLQISFYII